MVLDSAGRLLVSNCSVSFNGITVYANAGSANGNLAPTAVITGPATQLSACTDIALSPTGELFVGNQGTGGILVFNGSAIGNASPIRFISGDNTGIQVVSGFGNLRGIALDPTR
ncbi:MAG: hypothetical protein DMG65_01845 [Candidatus Angelobacter sp. Gp1-AA117]|nr:MAG: hypothetical protein DMG65_01845 [Candidatus Angelobacter sp. Gp1-AA117]